jgi:DNA polymerase III alpha subunit (gram-positive type)
METAASNANSYMPPSIANATIRLAIIKAKKSPLIDYMQKNIKEKADIEEVRSRLAKISDSMAQEIVESRAERL